MITYRGSRSADGRTHVSIEPVKGERRPLPPRNDLRNHSPDGFEWGYGGSGPAQLALAILAHAIGGQRALRLYQDFKREYVAGWRDDWSITDGEVRGWATSREELLRGTP